VILISDGLLSESSSVEPIVVFQLLCANDGVVVQLIIIKILECAEILANLSNNQWSAFVFLSLAHRLIGISIDIIIRIIGINQLPYNLLLYQALNCLPSIPKLGTES